MQQAEILKLLSLIEAEYPQSFKGLSEEHRKLKIELWRKEFERDDAVAVFAAVRTLMRSGREFAPTSGQIREKMNELSTVGTLDEAQAWALVSKACANGYYGYKKEFAKLPPEVQSALGSAEQLRAWSLVDEDTFQTVIASNFQRAYRAKAQRAKEMLQIPEEVRNVLMGVSERMAITDGKN